SSNRLGTCSRQSSTVIRAIASIFQRTTGQVNRGFARTDERLPRGSTSLRRYDFVLGYLPDPARTALFAWNNEPERTFHRSERVTLAAVGEQNDPVGKPGVEFGQREDRCVTIMRFDQDVQPHFGSAQFAPQWRA